MTMVAIQLHLDPRCHFIGTLPYYRAFMLIGNGIHSTLQTFLEQIRLQKLFVRVDL